MKSKKVLTGLDCLINEKISFIKNKNVGLISNQTSVNSDKTHIINLISNFAKKVLVFAPEHGFEGNIDDRKLVNDKKKNELLIYSIFGEFKSPNQKILDSLDVIIYDIQDVGIKFYTFISNLFIMMEIARDNNLHFIVLDRPNPLRADIVEGPITSPAFSSFIGVAPLPIRYGMTVGELALMFNNENYLGFKIDCKLDVLKMKNYNRSLWYDQTHLPWIPPSPNIPNLNSAILYPGICLFEGTKFSVGRGTKTPFLILGAPDINIQKLINNLPPNSLDGLQYKKIEFEPKSISGKESNPKFKNSKCNGIKFTIMERDKVNPIYLGVSLIKKSYELFPNELKPNRFLDSLWGSENLRASLINNLNINSILKKSNDQLNNFLEIRKNYLLYN